MANILCIDTSTSVGSVVFAVDGKVVFEKVSYEDRSHAVKTGVFVDEIMSEIETIKVTVDAVAVCSGPGSYTGLRIGVSLAKGLCYGLGVPLIAIDSLRVLANSVKCNDDEWLCPMIDARRMEVYCALYNKHLDVIEDISARVIDEDSFKDILSRQKVTFFGDGAKKCAKIIQSENAAFKNDIVPLARNMVALAESAFGKSQFENVAYFEPFYLKDFVATVPKKKGL